MASIRTVRSGPPVMTDLIIVYQFPGFSTVCCRVLLWVAVRCNALQGAQGPLWLPTSPLCTYSLDSVPCVAECSSELQCVLIVADCSRTSVTTDIARVYWLPGFLILCVAECCSELQWVVMRVRVLRAPCDYRPPHCVPIPWIQYRVLQSVLVSCTVM